MIDINVYMGELTDLDETYVTDSMKIAKWNKLYLAPTNSHEMALIRDGDTDTPRLPPSPATGPGVGVTPYTADNSNLRLSGGS